MNNKRIFKTNSSISFSLREWSLSTWSNSNATAFERPTTILVRFGYYVDEPKPLSKRRFKKTKQF